jgi:hypothetical protein
LSSRFQRGGRTGWLHHAALKLEALKARKEKNKFASGFGRVRFHDIVKEGLAVRESAASRGVGWI